MGKENISHADVSRYMSLRAFFLEVDKEGRKD